MVSNPHPVADLSMNQAPLTVSQLNHQVRYLLENNYGQAQVTGEISNLAKPASGHLYFTLKDANAQIRVALFKSSIGLYKPVNGEKVVVKGRISLYEPRGDYQMIASGIKAAGEGDLQQAFLKLKAKLEQEGLFDPANKKKLPEKIDSIGVITSASGAAIHDILTVLKRRYPAINIIIYPVAVQGAEAGKQIASAIQYANQSGDTDVLIVGRGGGSIEDLWAFNEEIVARAIADSVLPIVSAVGHEVDFTIADFVADERAATPSAAAELLSPDQQELAQTLDNIEARLFSVIQQNLYQTKQKTEQMAARLRHPGEKLSEQSRLLQQFESRLQQAQQNILIKSSASFDQLRQQLNFQNPGKQIIDWKQHLLRLQHSMELGIQNTLGKQQQQLQGAARTLNTVNPLSTLERGYAIAIDKSGVALTRSEDVAVGDSIEVKLHKGSLITEVKEKNSYKP